MLKTNHLLIYIFLHKFRIKLSCKTEKLKTLKVIFSFAITGLLPRIEVEICAASLGKEQTGTDREQNFDQALKSLLACFSHQI